MNLGGVGGRDGYDQDTMYKICKELIKIFLKKWYLPNPNLLSQ